MKSKLELSSYTDEEILSYLKDEWGIHEAKDIVVSGLLQSKRNRDNKRFFILTHIRNGYNELLDYPVTDIDSREKVSNRGVFVPPIRDVSHGLETALQEGVDIYIKCRLSLASKSERDKHQNPALIQVVSSSVRLLRIFNSSEVLTGEDGNILIEDSIYNTIYLQNKTQIEDDVNAHRVQKEGELNNELKVLENVAADFKEKNIELAGIKLVNESLLKEQEKKQSENINKLDKSKREISFLESELNNLKEAIKNDEENQMKKLERFKSFVKSKADTLLKLEFIDQNEYDELLLTQKTKANQHNSVNFHQELDGDFSSAAAHIQAFLFNKDILYPRYIIEDFFALIQTNDLIILAGESGSGKTNLVKSFAGAVGGVSKIIPVKPNWTSSEDLLGYYNPLEKKYLSTPFLDTLIEASKNPDVPYFICLDEMNLARVEYYFADFLSLLEERELTPEINLYSDDESSHVLSEFKNVLELIENSKEKYKKGNIVNFIELLQDKEINEELKRVFGFSDKDSLIKYHSDLRRMISGIINIPSSMAFPKNVRIIGAINIDETTHYLSPKILDRAHIMKFDSPLLFNWEQIEQEINTEIDVDKTVQFEIEDFGWRNKYPKFEVKNEFCKTITDLTKEFFTPLGIEVGLRTIRQGLNYQNKLLQFNESDSLFMNNFFIHKILPKMTFDGSKMVGDNDKKDLLLRLQVQLTPSIIKEKTMPTDGIDAKQEFDDLVDKSKANDWIVNYWA
jgi:energy-coupling factor transporter ATP-binding protein EcfA2